MITKSLENSLTEKGIVIDKKIPKEIFEDKQNTIINLYQNAGYQNINRELVLFLCYFNGIKIILKGYELTIDVADMLRFRPKSEMAYLEGLAGMSLYPIGMMQSGYYDLFADENGGVYAIHIEADEIIFYGENPFVALENILRNKKLETRKI